MVVLFIYAGVGVLVQILTLVIKHFKNKREKKYLTPTRAALEEKYSEGDILLAQQGFGPVELLKEYYHCND